MSRMIECQPVRQDSSVSRRQALLSTLAGAATFCLRRTGLAAETQKSQPVLLSEHGCGRATGYAEANKIVTFGDRTHVAWLDSPPEGFRVRIRTLDHSTGEWSRTYTLGAAQDNHGGPALTIDSDGFLHIVYSPHHHPMRYRKSKRPNDASEWEQEVAFGERLTYPTLVCGKNNTLLLTARRSFSDRPWQVELWTRTAGGAWQNGQAILAARYPGYAHFQESLAWGSDHRALHLCCRFHEKSDDQAYGRLQAVCYLMSPDAGRSWRRSDGSAVSLPATADSADVLATGGVDHERILRAGAMAVDANDRPHIVYSLEENGRSRLLIARPGEGSWKQMDLRESVTPQWSTWNITAPAGMTFTSAGEMIVAAQIQLPEAGQSTWGHPTNEVVFFRSRDDGRTFSFALITAPDPQRSHWLPNVERATGYNAVPAQPGILYTAGPPGETNRDLLSNGVFFAKTG